MKENEIQRAVFTHLRTRGAPGVFAFHPKNGGIHQRGRARGINAGLGVVSGVPDIIAIKAGQMFALELKTEEGKLVEHQRAVLNQLENCGAICGVVYGLNAALQWLEGQGLLLGRAA